MSNEVIKRARNARPNPIYYSFQFTQYIVYKKSVCYMSVGVEYLIPSFTGIAEVQCKLVMLVQVFALAVTPTLCITRIPPVVCEVVYNSGI